MKTIIKYYVLIDNYLTDDIILVIGFFAVTLGLIIKGFTI
tara:strand:+ start:2253 stop:2372 length:120 start_codon:yes stop_codon:yes gene_type:complete